MKKTTVFILFVLLSTAAFAINDKTGTNPGDFLKLCGGVKAASMGNAFVAVADDQSALYWNPAGLAQIKSLVFSSTYSSLFAGMMYSNFTMTTPLPGANMSTGVSIDYVSAGGIEETTASQPYGTGRTFSPSSIVLTAPMAFAPLEYLSFGMNIKALIDNIDTSEAVGYGFDFGVLWKATENISAGLSMRNVVGSLQKISKTTVTSNSQIKTDLASCLAAGIAYKLPFLTLALDYDMLSDNQGTVNIGAEYSLNDIFFGRIGFSSRSEENAGGNMGAGIGLKYGMMKLDYAYVPYGDLGITHRFSLGLILPESWVKPGTAEVKAVSAEAIAVPSAEVKSVSAEAAAVTVTSVEAAAAVSAEAVTTPDVVKKVIPVKKKAKVVKKPVKKRKR